DLQPEGLIGAIENMLPDGAHRKLFYLSIDFLRQTPFTPKQEIYQQTVEESYPRVRELAVHGSENPNLMPKDSITVRLHSVGGWGAITTGKNLALTLFDLLGYHIKANPKYGSEKKGQPTTFYLSAAPEPIKVNCEYYYVDVVLSPDPNVFGHTNALAGLKEGGVFVIQSDLDKAELVWESIPINYQQMIVENDIRVFYLDAFSIARDEATDPDLQLRMQGVAFQGAFFAASPVAEKAGFDEATLLKAIRDQLEHKFGSKGARVVEDNVRVVRRGFDEVTEITDKPFTLKKNEITTVPAEPAIPIMVKTLPQSAAPATDIHRFWEQTGNFYARGMGNDNLTDPFIGLGVMPAVTSLFRDMTGIRFEHPEWIAENCTACGNCYTVCPDTAIPGLVNDVGQVLDTVVTRVKKHGNNVEHLPRAVRQMERHLRTAMTAAEESDSVGGLIEEAIETTITQSALEGDERTALTREFQLFKEELDGFQFALSRPYFTLPEKKEPGGGGLLSITIDPYTCKGCMECVAVCDDDALTPVTQTPDSIKQLREHWDFWLDLPNTPPKYIRVDDLEERIGALETILLDKDNYLSFASGDGACLGCSEKTVIHVFIATVEALMQPRIARHVARLEELVDGLKRSVQAQLVGEIDLGDPAEIARVVEGLDGGDVTLAGIADRIEHDKGSQPIDPDWLKRVTGLIGKLEDLKWRYTEGTTGRGRSRMGMLNATGCTSVWGSTYPFNPYPFPWANHLFQDAPSLAMGVFEGHMAKMAEGFKTIRMAELELAGEYRPSEHDEFLTYFNWKQFSDEEFQLCPPVVAVGGDGAMYDIGFQNLSRMMASGKPIKVMVVDTQVYSNTGGQACTSGFFGQVSDMAQFGKAIQGKEEARKEIGLVGMAHRTTYVLQSTIAYASHMIEGFIEGLMARRPALFNMYTSCQPEHGIGDDMGERQAKLVVESRGYPLFKYDPDLGTTPAECFDIGGNPELDATWPSYTLTYREGTREKTLELPMTFADFAMTEVRFRKHFRAAPPDTWNEKMVPLHEFLELAEEDSEDLFPYIWTVDRKNHLSRLLVDQAMVRSCEDRRDFWKMLRALAGVDRKEPPLAEIEDRIRQDVLARITQGLAQIAGGEGGAVPAIVPPGAAPGAAPAAAAEPAAAAGDYMAAWLDTDECTACDECMRINSSIFAYNEDKKAYLKDPEGGPYTDIVKAAEKCTAQVIHPGLPRDRSARDIDKWIARGSKFN
ncbi:MAG: 2-oxoacid:acceptor oxidoreductase family protein, partial [Chromatiales bacterium]